MEVYPPIDTLLAVISAIAALICLLRLYSLELFPAYPALVWFMVFQIASTVVSRIAGPQSSRYEWVYVLLLLLQWLIYARLLREIYNTIFAEYPGIAVLGRWSIYGALTATVLVAAISIAANLQMPKHENARLIKVEMAAHCFVFGFAALLVLILIVISRYPIDLHKNVVITTLLFGSMLLSEATGLIFDQVTQRSYTAWVNLAISASEILCLALWPVFLEERTTSLKVIHHAQPEDEARLRRQLETVNSIVIRAIRK